MKFHIICVVDGIFGRSFVQNNSDLLTVLAGPCASTQPTIYGSARPGAPEFTIINPGYIEPVNLKADL